MGMSRNVTWMAMACVVVLSAGQAWAAGADSPQALVEAMAKGFETGDKAAVSGLVHQPDEQSKMFADAMGGLAVVVKKLQTFITEGQAKFPNEFGEMQGPGAEMTQIITKLRNAKIEVNGDTATAAIDEGGDDLQMKQIGGRWYATPDADDLAQAGEMVKMVPHLSTFADASVAAVREANTADELRQKLQAAMMQMMQAMMEAEQGGGGGAVEEDAPAPAPAPEQP